MAYTQRIGRKHRGVYRDRNGRKVYSPLVLHKDAALAWAVSREQRIRAGQNPAAGEMRLAEWAELWLDARQVEKTTAGAERYRIDAVLEEWGDWRLDSITSMAIKGWVKRLGRPTTVTRKNGTTKTSQLSPATILKYLNTLSSMLTAAVDEGLRPDNPCRAVRAKMERPPRQATFLTVEELDAVVARMHDPYDVAAYVLAYTGLRFGELAGLPTDRESLDLMNGLLHVQQTLIEVDGVREIKHYPKTPESIRTIWLPDHVVFALAEHLRKHPSPDGLVFHGVKGQPLSRHEFGRQWHKARKAAGVRYAKPHDLRHSNASWLVQSGKATLYDVQAHLGHGDPATTKLYAHLGDAHLDRIRDALGRPDVEADVRQQ